ncbi:FG-GAP-like repeat-containing protein [Halalkalibaculum sp. DA3122]|uniref:FG-GAP-like repeat-containing protein n=1 Tax=Halalkalibaculum sp. DA3122 TaxID=3373607 RepID=UPI003754D22F
MVGRLLLLTFVSSFLLISCSEPTPPDPTSEEYREAVSAFYLSLAAIESDQAVFAAEKMNGITESYPREPAAWANIGVFSMRRGNFELAAEQLSKAESLAPDNADIQFLFGILESRRGNIQAAIDHLQKAHEISPENSRITYTLISELERQDAGENADQIRNLLNELRSQNPQNLAVLLEMTRLAPKMDDASLLERSLDQLAEQSESWPEEIKNEFDDLREEILSQPIENLTFEIAYLRNNLNKLSGFEADFDQIELPPNQVGFLLTEFLWLPEPSTLNEAPDTGITFTQEPLDVAEGDWNLAFHLTLAEDTIPDVMTLGPNTAAFQDGPSFSVSLAENGIHRSAIETFDYNYDFLNDLAFAGSQGLRLYEQMEGKQFNDITPQVGLPPSIINDSYSGVWKADLDLDGDLDLVLAREEESPRVLRNNGDGTFSIAELFGEVQNPVDFAWGDIDADGDADAVFLASNGELVVYRNQRMGEFERVDDLPELPAVHSIRITDLDSDSYLDIAALTDQAVVRVYASPESPEFDTETVAELNSPVAGSSYKKLFVQDFDNNGGLDLIISTDSGSQLWLSDAKLDFALHSSSLPGNLVSTTDMNGNNRLDLIGMAGGTPMQVINNAGEMDYNGRMISPRASGTVGDQRINSFGIGGEIEIRSGLLYHKQLIDAPVVHFGLGTYDEAEMLRILWPNGSVQAEFAELGYGSKIFNEQLLKGSCPWIFTHNGEEMEFVTDFLWRTALGLRINAQGEGSVVHSIDWVKIEGDQLKPKDGYYDVRITAELWETHFFDHVSMMVVDHPKDTEVMANERFYLPAPEQKLYPMSTLNPVQKAIDQDRTDVTDLIRKKDARYVDTFDLTAYQGLAKEHYLEVDLGEQQFNKQKPVYLVADGWVYPTDSSINVAISQGSHQPPHGIHLQVPDGNGGWKTVKDDIGFPAGKSKTVLINLSDLSIEDIPQKVRLSTNMEIYWDRISWSEGKPDADIKTQKLQPEVAELRYRGFSELHRKSRFAPEIPDYQNIASTTPQWIDLVGYYTRFGEVGELVQEIDDRYVIMNAGDELVFKFKAPAPPPEGWERDFILIGDGWVKDGDYNTGHSKTVIPLPYHGMEDYSENPGKLEHDPVYQKHKEDWARFHTRYITPELLRTALRFENKGKQ